MERFKNVVCADLLIKKRKKDKTYILLMKRENTGSDDGYYELPGGHLEENEDIYNAMIREAKEELCINLKRKDIRLVHILHHYNGERINFIFETDKKLNVKIGEPNKCSELLWVNINRLPKNTTDKVKKIINNIRKNNLYDCL